MTILTPMKIHTLNNPTRRWVLSAGTACAAVLVSKPLFALTTAQAEALIDRMLAELNGIINSGRSANQMFGDFERLFAKYADIPIISPSLIGRDGWQRASSGQRAAFIDAFTGYIARKYGKRFRELIGGKVVVKNTVAAGKNHEVRTVADLRGSAPFEVSFFVSGRSGNSQFYDMRIEGISLRRAEANEVGAMLDRKGGNIDAMIADLKRAG